MRKAFLSTIFSMAIAIVTMVGFSLISWQGNTSEVSSSLSMKEMDSIVGGVECYSKDDNNCPCGNLADCSHNIKEFCLAQSGSYENYTEWAITVQEGYYDYMPVPLFKPRYITSWCSWDPYYGCEYRASESGDTWGIDLYSPNCTSS